jgi:iron(III) transport system ATP-binding protein
LILSLIFPTRRRESAGPTIAPDTRRLALEGVSMSYGATAAVRDVSLSVTPGEVLCLVGPSGSGKSTLLRLVAGIERPHSGCIRIDGREVAGAGAFIDPEERAVGMVFQDFALFPHLTVTENVAFGLRGTRTHESREIVNAMLDRVGLRRYASAYPHTLSGGERQRVALARALAPSPRILLMDEPFSSLDSRLRDHVRQQTMDVLRETRTTTMVVTHEPDEAMRIGDRIALLREGRLEQIGTPRELYSQPRTLFAARFFSDVNELPGRVFIRPEHLRIASRPTNMPARVIRSEFRGEIDHIVLVADGVPSPITLRAFGRTSLTPGDAVHLEVPEENVLVVSHEH